MNNNYNLLMATRINMINQELNEKYIRKFNLNINTIKRKKKRKLSIKKLDELKFIIKDLQKIPKDKNFQDYILRHLKVFLIYGNIHTVSKDTIVLSLTTNNKKFLLTITIHKDCIKSILTSNNYQEEATWKILDNDYYTKYQINETDIYKDKTTSLYNINTTEELHGFHENKEIVTQFISNHDNYIKDNINQSINRHGFGADNYKDIVTYYRQDGFIIMKHKRRYKKRNIGNILNYKEYKISEDYSKDEKYLNRTGYYKNFDSSLYNSFLEGKCNIKSFHI